MRCLRFISCAFVLALACVPPSSWAQTPHFTSCTTTTVSGLLLVTGQVAGLGNQMRPPTPLTFEATADAVCLDPTTVPPTVLATVTVTKTVTYPPKNGNRTFGFAFDEPFVLPCVPPAEIVFVQAAVCDVTHDLCCTPPFPAPDPEPEPEPEPE